MDGDAVLFDGHQGLAQLDIHVVATQQVQDADPVGRRIVLGHLIGAHLRAAPGGDDDVLALHGLGDGDFGRHNAAAHHNHRIAQFTLLAVAHLDVLVHVGQIDARHLGLAGFGARGDDNGIIAAGKQPLRSCLLVDDIDVRGGDAVLVEGDEPFDIALDDRIEGRLNHGAAQFPLLEQVHVMAALGRHACGFHATGAAAYHSHALLGRKRLDLPHGGAIAVRVHRAEDAPGRIEVLKSTHASHGAADAGADLLGDAGLDLGNPVRVGEQRTGDTGEVGLALRQHLFCHCGSDNGAGDDDGDADARFLVLRSILGMGGDGIEHGGDAGIQVAGIHVDGIGTRRLEHTGEFDAILNMEVLIVGDQLIAGEAHQHGEILAAGSLDCLDGLHGETGTVLQGAAPLIFTLVELRRKEHLQQVAAGGVDFNRIETCLLHPESGLGEVFDGGLDLLFRHAVDGDGRTCVDDVDAAGAPGGRFGGEAELLADVAELHGRLHAVMVVNHARQTSQARSAGVVRSAELAFFALAGDVVDVGGFQHQKAGAARSQRLVIVQRRLRHMPILGVVSRSDRREDQPVGHPHLSDIARTHQIRIRAFHTVTPLFSTFL